MQKFVDILPPRKDLAKRRDAAAAEVERIERERQKCLARQNDAEKRLAEIDKQHNELRAQRQKFMIEEKDREAEGVEKQLEQLEREEPRLKELQAGLVRVIGECGTFAARAAETLKVAEEQLGQFDLFVLYDGYNERAAALAETVRGIHDKRLALGLSTEGWSDAGVHADHKIGALINIPKLMTRQDQEKAIVRDKYFFNIQFWKTDAGMSVGLADIIG